MCFLLNKTINYFCKTLLVIPKTWFSLVNLKIKLSKNQVIQDRNLNFSNKISTLIEKKLIFLKLSF